MSGGRAADLVWCQRVAADGGHDLIAAKALHNLGYCDLLAGDIPGRAAALQRGRRRLPAERARLPAVLAMDKARALLAAGLASDAASELDGAMASFRRQRLDQDLADAELARAQAALAAGEPGGARRWAAAAERRFRRRGNDACACVAELTRLRARSVAPGRRAPIAAEALLLAERLRGCGLANDAEMAELIAARRSARGRPSGRGQAAIGGGAPPQGRRCRWPSACCAGWRGPSWPSGKGGPGRRWPSFGPAWRMVQARTRPARQR